MPACFQLVREPGGFVARLYEVDREICQNLEIPYQEERWAAQWYDTIGFRLALGWSWERISDNYLSQWEEGNALGIVLRRVAAYLQEHYRVEAWYQRHK